MSWRDRHWLAFSGRATRLELLQAFGLSCLMALPLGLLAYSLLLPGSVSNAVIITLLTVLVFSPLLTCMVRRGHDLGWSALLTLGVTVGGLVVGILGKLLRIEGLELAGAFAVNVMVITLLLRRGEAIANAYGPPPLLPPRRGSAQ